MIDLMNFPKDVLVTLYSEDVENEQVFGFIVCCDEEELILACVTNQGENDGFLWIKTESIFRVDYESSYEKKLETLYRLKAQEHEAIPSFNESQDFRNDLLLWAQKEKKIAEFFIKDADTSIIGYIEDPDACRIKCVDVVELKPEQGYTYIDLDKVDNIWVDEERARNAELVLRQKANADTQAE